MSSVPKDKGMDPILVKVCIVVNLVVLLSTAYGG